MFSLKIIVCTVEKRTVLPKASCQTTSFKVIMNTSQHLDRIQAYSTNIDDMHLFTVHTT